MAHPAQKATTAGAPCVPKHPFWLGACVVLCLAPSGQTGHHHPMRLILLTALTMAAFAGNSVLNRFAVGQFGMDPASFALIRVLAGAVVLALLLVLRRGAWPRLASGIALGIAAGTGPGTGPGVAGLALYLAAFSVAYAGLAAGTGALILFGTVQITMFAGAMLRGQPLAPLQAVGAAVAFSGLLVLLWPGAAPVAVMPALAMVIAGVGWGVYSLAGGGSTDALAGTAVNFVLTVPVMVLVWWAMGAAPLLGPGLWLAVLSGAVTSGLGYALWYAILPRLGPQRAAVAQLTVPVIAAAGGVVWLDEGVGPTFVLASLLVLGGVGLASLPGRATIKKR